MSRGVGPCQNRTFFETGLLGRLLQHRLHRSFQSWKMSVSDIPDDRRLNSMILVSKQIADIRDLPPRNIWKHVNLFEIETPARLRHDLETALDGALRRPAQSEGLQAFAVDCGLNACDRFGDISQSNAMASQISINSQRRVFDFWSQVRMDTTTGHDIGRRGQKIADMLTQRQ